MSKTIVCSTTHLFHYLFNPNEETLNSFLQDGIRPLSDFPDSERWQELETYMPGFYENLYNMMAKPLIQKPYTNSGIFITPIDFRLLPDTYLHDKPRFRIPVERIKPDVTVISYVLNEERLSLPFNIKNRQKVADLWDAKMVQEWFAKDNTKVFFYVPQVAAYQGHIDVAMNEYEPAPA